MKIPYLYLYLLLLFSSAALAQNDNPYASFGYQGNKISTPQERKDYMLLIPNTDSLSHIGALALSPQTGTYYLFDREDRVIAAETLDPTQVTRFFARDPLADSYAWNSPYAFSENRVIDGTELEGLEWDVVKRDLAAFKDLFTPDSYRRLWKQVKETLNPGEYRQQQRVEQFKRDMRAVRDADYIFEIRTNASIGAGVKVKPKFGFVKTEIDASFITAKIWEGKIDLTEVDEGGQPEYYYFNKDGVIYLYHGVKATVNATDQVKVGVQAAKQHVVINGEMKEDMLEGWVITGVAEAKFYEGDIPYGAEHLEKGKAVKKNKASSKVNLKKDELTLSFGFEGGIILMGAFEIRVGVREGGDKKEAPAEETEQQQATPLLPGDM